MIFLLLFCRQYNILSRFLGAIVRKILLHYYLFLFRNVYNICPFVRIIYRVLILLKWSKMCVIILCRPTFYRICRKKSSEGFQSIPYSISFFSASMLLYYAYLKTNAYMIVSINGIGCVIEALYIFLYILYAPKKVKVSTLLLLLLLALSLPLWISWLK